MNDSSGRSGVPSYPFSTPHAVSLPVPHVQAQPSTDLVHVYASADEASFVNGEDMVIDGGLIWGRRFSDVAALRQAFKGAFE